MITKVCTKCTKELPLENYYLNNKGVYGRTSRCKECLKLDKKREILIRKTTYSPMTLAKSILSNNKLSAKRKGYAPPSYTAQELHDWLVAQNNFESLYNAWVSSGYCRENKPSADRIDDYKSYTLNNIKLTTSLANVQRYGRDALSGINTKRCIAVNQLTTDGVFIKRFHSMSAAAREYGMSIHYACNKGSIAYGYRWERCES